MTDASPHTPTLLGDFSIKGVLGEGGSGTVYDARWGHREVALKVLRGDLDGGERERFLAEARLLVEMTHPGVVKVLAAGTLPDGRPYLAMEKLPGESLARRLGRAPIPLGAAVGLFAQLCDAVAAMHARALIHRDLKPENVMLVPGPSGEHAVLLDFGIAKTADGGGVAAPTQSGLVRGTPAYMAPERFFGHPASVSTDVYELAVTFFAMVAGRLPWADTADPEVRLNPARLGEVATVPPAIDEVIARALSTRAPNRPVSASALCDAIVAGAGLAGAGVIRHTAPVERSGPIAASALAAQLSEAPTERATPGAGATPWTDGGKATTTTSSAASGQRAQSTTHVRGRRWPLAAGVAAGVALLGGAGIYLATRGPSGAAQVATSADDPWAPVDRPPVVLPPDAPPRPRIAPDLRDQVREQLAEGFARLPLDAHLVGGVAIAELQGTPELDQLLAGLGETEWRGLVGLTFGTCVLELAGQTRWATFGAADAGDGFDLVAQGTWTRDEVEGCLAGAGKVEVKRQARRGLRGTPISIVPRLGQDVVLGWIDDHTLVASNRTGADVEHVGAMLAARPPGAARAPGSAIAAGLDRRAAAWLVADRDALATVVETPALRAGDGSLRLTFDDGGDLGVQVAIVFPDPTLAEAGQAEVEKSMSELTDMIGFDVLIPDFSIRRDGPIVRLHTVINAGLIEGLAEKSLEALRR